MNEYQKSQFAQAIVNAVTAAETRGVQQPTVVLEENGDFSYIPGAHLTDISYTGSHDVLLQFNDAAELFGSEWKYDPDTIYRNAEWLAEEYSRQPRNRK